MSSNFHDDLMADLITTNEIGTGERDYREVDGVLYVDVYETDQFGPDGFPIPDHTYRIGFVVEEVFDE